MGKHPTQEKKAVAVYLLTKTDKPIQEITRDTGMSKSALFRLRKRFQDQLIWPSTR